MGQVSGIIKKLELAPQDQENVQAFYASFLDYYSSKKARTLKAKFFRNTALYIVGSCLKGKEYNDIDLALVGLTRTKYWNEDHVNILPDLGEHLKYKLKKELDCNDDFFDWRSIVEYSADCWKFMILSQKFHPINSSEHPLHFSVLTNDKSIKKWEKHQQEKSLPYLLLWKSGMTDQNIITKNLKVNKT